MGLVGIVKLSEFLHMGTNTAAHIWLGGVGMAWVHIIVQTMIPDIVETNNVLPDMIAVVCLAIALQAFQVRIIRKYLGEVQMLHMFYLWS